MKNSYTFNQAFELAAILSLIISSFFLVVFLFFYYRLENKVLKGEQIGIGFNGYVCKKVE
jgi:hypothetical protein